MVRPVKRLKSGPPIRKLELEKDVTPQATIKREVKQEPSEDELKSNLKVKIEKKLKRLAKGEETYPEWKKKKEVPPVTKQQEEAFKKTYYTPETGFRTAQKQVDSVRSRAPGITYEQVDNLVSKQEADVITSKKKKPKIWNSIVSSMPGGNYQMDLMNYNRYAYAGFDWILNIVDVYSRKAGARAIKTLKISAYGERKTAPKVTGEQYLKAYIDIIEKDFDGKYPKHLSCDVEFIDKNFVAYVTEHGTKIHYSQVGQFNKNAIVERFNGTLANLIQRWRVGNRGHDKDWPKVLPALIHNYNNTHHTTIKAIPELVWKGEEKNKQTVVRLFSTMKEGDKVKRKIFYKPFQKGDALKYSDQTYVLVEKIGNRWKIKDIESGEIYRNPTAKIKGPELFKEDQLIRVGDILTKPTAEEAEAKYQAEKEQEEKFMKPEEEKELEKKEAIVDEAGRQIPIVDSREKAKEEVKKEQILKVHHSPVTVGKKRKWNKVKSEKQLESDIKSKLRKKLVE